MKIKETQLEDELIFSGKILDLHKYRVCCANRAESHREVVHLQAHAACIIAKVEGKFALVKQFRFPFNSCLLEFPAGKVNSGELTKAAAIRELEEEIGYHADKITFLGDIYPSPGYTDEVISIYYANELVKSATHYDEDECLETQFYSASELEKLIANNKIKDAKTIIGFYLFKSKNL